MGFAHASFWAWVCTEYKFNKGLGVAMSVAEKVGDLVSPLCSNADLELVDVELNGGIPVSYTHLTLPTIVSV